MFYMLIFLNKLCLYLFIYIRQNFIVFPWRSYMFFPWATLGLLLLSWESSFLPLYLLESAISHSSVVNFIGVLSEGGLKPWILQVCRHHCAAFSWLTAATRGQRKLPRLQHPGQPWTGPIPSLPLLLEATTCAQCMGHGWWHQLARDSSWSSPLGGCSIPSASFMAWAKLQWGPSSTGAGEVQNSDGTHLPWEVNPQWSEGQGQLAIMLSLCPSMSSSFSWAPLCWPESVVHCERWTAETGRLGRARGWGILNGSREGRGGRWYGQVPWLSLCLLSPYSVTG